MHWIALQLLPDALQGQSEEHSVADPLAALAWQALQFTPKVARVALDETAEALVMEISGSERLFGGRGPLLRLIYTKNSALAPVKYTQAATSLVAIAKLQRAGERASLPLHTLAAARPHLAMLARIGCTCWGDVRALPRDGVARRFGADLLDALDRAYGQKPELYPWLTLPSVFAAKIELHAQVETAPALMFGAQRLLRQLQLWLRLRNEGVAALEFGWTMDARRNTAREGALTLRTALATQDIAHLQRLLGENLARLTLPAPALYVSLRTLRTEPLALQSAPLLLEEAQKGDSLHQMVERLTARLGADNVLQLQTRADHRPETLQKWNLIKNLNQFKSFEIPIKGANKQNNARVNAVNFLSPLVKNKFSKPFAALLQADALYPTWLLQPPLPLAVLHGMPHYQGPLTLVAGPERLEAGWWEGRHNTALRDYFIAQSEQAGLLWVFRERLGERLGGRLEERLGEGPGSQAGLSAGSGAWYLHGRFD